MAVGLFSPLLLMIKLINILKHEYLLFFLCIVITLFNTVNMQSSAVMLFSVPQYLLVFFFIIHKDYRSAFLFHSIFVAACVSLGTVIEDGQSAFFYTKFVIYGPINLNFIVLITLWLSLIGKPILLNKGSLLYKTKKVIFYLLIMGTVIGLFGCLFLRYYDWKFLINRILFVGEIYLFIDIFSHLYSDSFSRSFAIVALCMMAAAPVASIVSFTVFNVHTFYGDQATALVNPILGLTPCLIIALFQLNSHKLRIVSLIGLVFYAFQLMILSRGHQFLDVFVVLMMLLYLVYFKRDPNQSFRIKILKIVLPILIVGVVPFAIGGLTSSSDVSMRKFEQFMSLFKMFNYSDNNLAFSLEDVGSSPYVRVAELANIINEGMHNVFALFFGKGFGGYYTDSLDLFSGIDLSRGAFSYDAAIKYGRFYNGHGAIPSLSLYNGLIGLFLMLKLAFSYLKNVDKTFLVFAAFVLMVQNFFFDLYGCLSFTIALFGTEYMISGTNKVSL